MDPRFPTTQEQGLLAQGLVIIKRKLAQNNIQPHYHKWRDIWSDDWRFYVNGSNQNLVFRALAVTMPVYWVDDTSVKEWTYEGYVIGLAIKDTGRAKIFPLAEIVWVKTS